jgi:hypothetical protein
VNLSRQDRPNSPLVASHRIASQPRETSSISPFRHDAARLPLSAVCFPLPSGTISPSAPAPSSPLLGVDGRPLYGWRDTLPPPILNQPGSLQTCAPRPFSNHGPPGRGLLAKQDGNLPLSLVSHPPSTCCSKGKQPSGRRTKGRRSLIFNRDREPPALQVPPAPPVFSRSSPPACSVSRLH